jgi:hypothetical protein
VEQHVAVAQVGVVAGDQGLDHRQDLADVLGGARLHRRLEGAQGGDVLAVGSDETLGERPDGLAISPGRGIDLVVDVGDVAHVDDLGVEHREQPIEHVEDRGRAAVADVHPGVDRRPADVHRDPMGVDGLEWFLQAALGVV